MSGPASSVATAIVGADRGGATADPRPRHHSCHREARDLQRNRRGAAWRGGAPASTDASRRVGTTTHAVPPSAATELPAQHPRYALASGANRAKYARENSWVLICWTPSSAAIRISYTAGLPPELGCADDRRSRSTRAAGMGCKPVSAPRSQTFSLEIRMLSPRRRHNIGSTPLAFFACVRSAPLAGEHGETSSAAINGRTSPAVAEVREGGRAARSTAPRLDLAIGGGAPDARGPALWPVHGRWPPGTWEGRAAHRCREALPRARRPARRDRAASGLATGDQGPANARVDRVALEMDRRGSTADDRA